MSPMYKPEYLHIPPAGLLPDGFIFPKTFLDYVTRKEIPDPYPWEFFCHSKRPERFKNWIDILRKQYPKRLLVPFAKWSFTDDVACFEPEENKKLPGIHFIHTFTDPGYEERGYCATFEEWLEIIIEEAREYQADRPDYLDYLDY